MSLKHKTNGDFFCFLLQPKNRQNQRHKFVPVKMEVFASKTPLELNSVAYVNPTLAATCATSRRSGSDEWASSVQCL